MLNLVIVLQLNSVITLDAQGRHADKPPTLLKRIFMVLVGHLSNFLDSNYSKNSNFTLVLI